MSRAPSKTEVAIDFWQTRSLRTILLLGAAAPVVFLIVLTVWNARSA